MVSTAADLIEAIKLHQKVNGLSDKAFARLVGIDNSTWSRIKSGERNPGGKVLRAIASNIPELQLLVFQYMANSDKEKVEAASD